jgi:hypothetical protein
LSVTSFTSFTHTDFRSVRRAIHSRIGRTGTVEIARPGEASLPISLTSGEASFASFTAHIRIRSGFMNRFAG